MSAVPSSPSTWWVDLRCQRCSAPGRYVAEHLVAVCAFCGAIVAAHKALGEPGLAQAAAETRAFVAPSLIDVRRLELADAQAEAWTRADRPAWVAAARELAALDAMAHRGNPVIVGAWARWKAACDEWSTFATTTRWTAPNLAEFVAAPGPTCVAMRDGLIHTFAAMSASADFPHDLAHLVAPEVAAMDAVLTCLRAWALMVPRAALDDGLRALGQTPLVGGGQAPSCRTCSAPLEAQALADGACAYCRHAVEVRQHPLLDALIRTTLIASAMSVRARDRASTAVGLLYAHGHLTADDLPSAWIAAYFDGVGGIAQADVVWISELMLAHYDLTPTQRGTVMAVRAHAESLPPAVPPVPGTWRDGFLWLSANEAWVRAARRNWRRMLAVAQVPREQLALASLTAILAPLAGGARPDDGDAAAYLRATELPLLELRAAIALHRTGESDATRAAFWDALTARL